MAGIKSICQVGLFPEFVFSLLTMVLLHRDYALPFLKIKRDKGMG